MLVTDAVILDGITGSSGLLKIQVKPCQEVTDARVNKRVVKVSVPTREKLSQKESQFLQTVLL